MKRWYGKLFGAIAGALLVRGNPLFGALVGLIVGHAFDADWFQSGRSRRGRDNPYGVLDIAEDANEAQIDLAYRRKMSQYHPDRFTGATPELRRQAEAKAREINSAYDRIMTLRRKGARRE